MITEVKKLTLIRKCKSIRWLRHITGERDLHVVQVVWLTTIYKIAKHSAKIIYIRPGEPSLGSVLLLSLPFLSEKEFLLQQQMPPGTNWHSLAISAQSLMKYLLSLRVSEEVISPAQNWDSVMRQDKDDSSANAHSSPVPTETKKKKWDSSICLRNPGSPCIEEALTLHFTAHRKKDHKQSLQ